MASQELLGGDQIRIVGVGLLVARPDQRFGRGDKQHLSTLAKLIVQGESSASYMVLDWNTLTGNRAAEKGTEERI